MTVVGGEKTENGQKWAERSFDVILTEVIRNYSGASANSATCFRLPIHYYLTA